MTRPNQAWATDITYICGTFRSPGLAVIVLAGERGGLSADPWDRDRFRPGAYVKKRPATAGNRRVGLDLFVALAHLLIAEAAFDHEKDSIGTAGARSFSFVAVEPPRSVHARLGLHPSHDNLGDVRPGASAGSNVFGASVFGYSAVAASPIVASGRETDPILPPVAETLQRGLGVALNKA